MDDMDSMDGMDGKVHPVHSVHPVHRPRAVFLGASNVARSLAVAVETARLRLRPGEGGLEVLAAVGRGRSYGQRSLLLGRGLPGILDCALWRAAEEGEGPLYAVLTDIGNDVGYGVAPEQIAEWVEECVRRFTRLGARIVLTPPPTVSIARRADWQILLARQVLFPFSDLTPGQARRRVAELEERLRGVASRWETSWVDHRDEWYGFDPIHIRLPYLRRAWAEILAPWADGQAPLAAPGWTSRVRLGLALPDRFSYLGIPLSGRGARLKGGVRVELY